MAKLFTKKHTRDWPVAYASFAASSTANQVSDYIGTDSRQRLDIILGAAHHNGKIIVSVVSQSVILICKPSVNGKCE